MSFIFNDENMQKIKHLKTRYPHLNSLVLPTLWMAQHQDGYISIQAIEEISKILDMPTVHIYSVCTFYTMFKLEKDEKPLIEVCKTLSCMLCGSEDIIKYLKSKNANIKYVECLGACSKAPTMNINDTNYSNLTYEKIDTILKKLK